MADRRKEIRTRVQLPMRVSGVDGQGLRFTREVVATNICRSGALLSGVNLNLRCGDYLTIAYEGHRANFRIVWARTSSAEGHAQVAVQKVENQPCPWEAELPPEQVASANAVETSTPRSR